MSPDPETSMNEEEVRMSEENMAPENGEEATKAEIVLYQQDGRNVPVEVSFWGGTFWMEQKTIADMFEVTPQTIARHLANIFDEGELSREATSTKNVQVRNEGSRTVRREISFYNLDAIIAVGYRVNSMQATKFRQWATKTLKEYVVKGFVLNDDMLKNGRAFGTDYFDELLERIRDIRASERRFYQKINDMFEAVSFDYVKDSQTARNFYSGMQNKLHFAITGMTAAEIIDSRVDSSKPNMGLTSWKRSPDGPIGSKDVVTAKNYLSEREIRSLNTLTSGLLDLVASRVERHTLTSMKECAQLVDSYIQLSGMPLLEGFGRRTSRQAAIKATAEYRKYDKERESDFDKFIKHVAKNDDHD